MRTSHDVCVSPGMPFGRLSPQTRRFGQSDGGPIGVHRGRAAVAAMVLLIWGCNEPDRQPNVVIQQAAVTSNYQSAMADTVLGALAPTRTMGDLATKKPSQLKTGYSDSIDTIVFVKGLITPGDGGGGNFYWDWTTSACIDDGQNTILVGTSPPSAIGGTGSGCWRRQVNGGVNGSGQMSTGGGPIAVGQMDAGVFRLKNYVKPADCIDDMGHPANCDLKPAFDAALAACDALRTSQGDSPPTAGFRGCVFLLPEGKFRLKGTVELCRMHVIRGDSFWNGNAATQITAYQSPAFWMHGYAYCQNTQNSPRGQGGRSHIVGLEIDGLQSTDGSVPVLGIKMEDQGVLENVKVTNFVIGIKIAADTTVSPPARANANQWRLTNVSSESNRFAGIFVEGYDVNAGLALGVTANGNCDDKSTAGTMTAGHGGNYWKDQAIDGRPALGYCAGIIDKSYLGNTWVGTHVQDSIDTSTTPPTLFEGYHFDGGYYQSSVCLGCYSETGQRTNYMQSGANIFGGYSNWYGPGFWLHSNVVSSLKIENTLNPAYKLTLDFGLNADNAAWRLSRSPGKCSQNSGNPGAPCSANNYCTGAGTCQYLGVCGASSGNPGALCSSNLDCTNQGACGFAGYTSELSLQWDDYIKGYGFHVNGVGSGTFGALNFLMETNSLGLQGFWPPKAYLQPTFTVGCSSQNVCAGGP
jgi:hypothetical protein